ncbi:glucose-6-phosphate isomerase [Thalassotalea sp. G2M2-11]|uniref:glucose-6-phosphate isomerase n=1 Tax=Thalassotalea sp. G2M2-11 TaxID=2787627 RepID=UPI00321803C3
MENLANIIALANKAKNRAISPLFNDPSRVEKMSVTCADIFLDYSKQNIIESELTALVDWANHAGLSEKITQMFNGVKINRTENRAVLHTILRASEQDKKTTLGREIASEVIATEQKMAGIVDDVYQGKRLSLSGQKFTDVLAIGIGGSYYGIKVGLSALKPYQNPELDVHVLANVDGGAVQEKLNQLNAETTLVVVISKTFTTQETLLNAQTVKAWMLASQVTEDIIAQQWLAVSTNIDAATQFGIAKDNILPMWDWVGGRFSLWSAVGLPLALAIGNDNFSAIKRGANTMDQHFLNAPLSDNMPVLLALLGIWNRNGLGYSSLAILPYDHSLRSLPGYLQQTDMESNGKSVSIQGEKLEWKTAPVVFGQEGTNGQHAFMQLMHQSEDIIPCDFIVAMQSQTDLAKHHNVLVANCFAQSEALMQGKTLEQATKDLVSQGVTREEAATLAPHKVMKGNTPSNTLLINKLTPKTLGALLALYEHKIFVQGALWQLNSFDQWGVELGKTLSHQVLVAMAGEAPAGLSDSTLSLINHYKKENQ